MQKSKGFTIIELLVVIAIIAVLTAIVLVNVTGYINKGKDAAIEGDLTTIKTNAASWYTTNGSYTNFPTDASYTTPATAATSAGGTVANNVTATAFCACSKLTSNQYNVFCVDSTGIGRVSTTGTSGTPVTCANECPAAAACVTSL